VYNTHLGKIKKGSAARFVDFNPGPHQEGYLSRLEHFNWTVTDDPRSFAQHDVGRLVKIDP
jgi:hypothetical protein